MPVHALHTVGSGSRSKLLLVYAGDPATGLGLPGLRHDSPGASAAYVREGAGVAIDIDLVPGTPGEWTPGGFVEIDPIRLPGFYQLGLPDAALAEGSPHVLLLLRSEGAAIAPIEIELVAYDPLDEMAIGMAELQDRGRHQFLRSALPRLTEMELEQGRDGERELSRKLAGRGPEERAG